MSTPPEWLPRWRLKSSTHAEAEDALALVEEERVPVNDLVRPGRRIVRVNYAERHVDDGHLETQLRAEARAYVAAQAGEEALVQAHQSVRLHVAAQEDLLEAEGQTRGRVNRPHPYGVGQLRNTD